MRSRFREKIDAIADGSFFVVGLFSLDITSSVFVDLGVEVRCSLLSATYRRKMRDVTSFIVLASGMGVIEFTKEVIAEKSMVILKDSTEGSIISMYKHFYI